MLDLVFENIFFAIGFYFLLLLPLYTLLIATSFSGPINKVLGVDISFGVRYLFVYAFWGLLSLFAISIVYYLYAIHLLTYYYPAQFFVVVPILSFLFKLLFTWIYGKKIKGLWGIIILVLNSFSFFTALMYMRLVMPLLKW